MRSRLPRLLANLLPTVAAMMLMCCSSPPEQQPPEQAVAGADATTPAGPPVKPPTSEAHVPTRTTADRQTGPPNSEASSRWTSAVWWGGAVVVVVSLGLFVWFMWFGRMSDRRPIPEALPAQNDDVYPAAPFVREPEMRAPREREGEVRVPRAQETEMRVSLSRETLMALQDIARAGRDQEPRLDGLRSEIAALQQLLNEHATFMNHLKDEQRKLIGDVRDVGQRDLESLFADWKHANLGSAQQEDASRTLEDFRADEAVLRDLDEAREALERTTARATVWFESLNDWDPAAVLPSAPQSNGLIEAISTYCLRGSRLVQSLEEWLTKSDLSTVPSDAGLDVSVFDVVAGRSAEQIASGYRARLERRRADVVAKAKELGLEWSRLREALPGLLDGYYAVAAELVGVGARTVDDQGLSRALAAAKVQEIPVQPGRTSFDPTLHEAVPGARRLRSDLAENTVVQLERRGFFHEGKVLRKALVSLSSAAA